MFTFKNLSTKSVGEVAPGNLIYVLGEQGPQFAMRIEHPSDAPNGPTYAAALIFRYEISGKTLPVIDAGCAPYPCIDCGVHPELVWDPPLELLTAGASPDVGHVLLSGKEAGISSSYGPGGYGRRQYWNPYTGKAIDPRPSPPVRTAIIVKWRLGAIDLNGDFRQLIAFPDDYGKWTATEG